MNVEVDEGIAWVELNRPEKRNAMSPTLNAEMVEVLDALDADDDCGVLVLTGAGDSWSAGMDLKEYFREVDASPEHVQRRVRRDAAYWQWRLLRTYAKPTIAMVNGWCFGGAFTPLVACDLAIAADEATFGLSEINWGIPPGSVVSKALADTVGSRAGLLYVMTGRTFDGQQAAEMGLVNASVPRARAPRRGRVARAGAAGKNPVVLRAAKLGFKHCGAMSWDQAEDYLYAKLEQSQFLDTEQRPRAGARAVPRREADQARPAGLRAPAVSVEPRLSYVIGRLDRVLRRRLGAAVEPAGLTLPAYTALSVLRAQDGLSNAQLARRSLITPQSMSEVLALLVEQGYVRRRAEPGHGRMIRIELTAAGSRALARCDRAVDGVEREMLGGLDADEAASLRSALSAAAARSSARPPERGLKRRRTSCGPVPWSRMSKRRPSPSATATSVARAASSSRDSTGSAAFAASSSGK